MRISPPSEGTPPALAPSPETAVHTLGSTAPQRARCAVSVVVPTLGRPRLLHACLSALHKLRLERCDLEVIIVDDGPSAMTQDIVAAWTGRFLDAGMVVRYEANPGPHGPAAARNRGWRTALGEVIAFTDDDTEPTPHWIDQGLRAFDSGNDAAWGRIVMPIPPVPTDYELDARGLEDAGFVTANCFCRRATLERLGGFDENFRAAWREDTDFYFRLLESGARVAHVPNAVVVHPVRPAPWGISLKQQRKVLFDALLYKKHPRLYRARIRARPRFDYYAMVLLLVGALAGLVLREPALLMTAGLPWLAMSAWFCAKRLLRTSKSPLHVAEMIVTSALIPPVAVFWRVVGAVRFRTLFL